MSLYNFSLILSCGGFELDKLTLCSGTSNSIINFENYIEPIAVEKLMDFLDFSCKLFDGPMSEWNKVVNTVRILRERFGLVDDRIWTALHTWFIQHKHCGAVLRLEFNDFAQNKEPEEVLVLPQKDLKKLI